MKYIQEHKNVSKAFNQYWEDKIGPYNPLDDTLTGRRANAQTETSKRASKLLPTVANPLGLPSLKK